MTPEILAKEQYNLSLPFFEGIEYPQSPLVSAKKQSTEDFDDFVEAPSESAAKKQDPPPPPESKPKDRLQLMDEVFGSLDPPAPAHVAPLSQENPTVAPIKPTAPVTAPIVPPATVALNAMSEPEQKKPAELPPDFVAAEGEEKVADNAQDDDFGEFQDCAQGAPKKTAAENPSVSAEGEDMLKKVAEPAHAEDQKNHVEGGDAPLIYRLTTEEAAAKKADLKAEEDAVVENIVIKDDDTPQAQDIIKPEPKSQVPTAAAAEPKTLVELDSPMPKAGAQQEPTAVSLSPDERSVPRLGKEGDRWKSLLDIDFGAAGSAAPSVAETKPEASAAKVEEVPAATETKKDDEPQDFNEEDLIQNFVDRFGPKAKPDKTAEEKKAMAETKPAAKREEGKNAFCLGERRPPAIPEGELGTNMEFLRQLEEWLWYSEETEKFEVVKEHIHNLETENDFAQKKKDATDHEQFELSIEYRNKAKAAHDKLLPDPTIKGFCDLSPDESTLMSGLIDRVIALGDLQLVRDHEPIHGSTSSSRESTCKSSRNRTSSATPRPSASSRLTAQKTSCISRSVLTELEWPRKLWRPALRSSVPRSTPSVPLPRTISITLRSSSRP